VHFAFIVPVFDPGQVSQDRRGPDADRILVARITGTARRHARRHARWRDLTADEKTAAIAELTELAAGRADLLAEVADVLMGASEGRLDEPFARRAAQLCRLAGADEASPVDCRGPAPGRSRPHATTPVLLSCARQTRSPAGRAC
jgi:hypothetical protein